MAREPATAVMRRTLVVAMVVGVVLLGTACASTEESPANLALPTAPPTSTAEAVSKAAPAPENTAEPTTTPVPTITAVSPLPGVNAIGDLVPAAPGTHVIARPVEGFLLADGGFIVPVYDEPDGPPRVLVDRNEIDGVRLTFPLRSPTVFDQPLVLRVIAGTPADEWLLVQAPVRPHQQHVWVRADDFTFAQSNLRIEVDLGREGRFAGSSDFRWVEGRE